MLKSIYCPKFSCQFEKVSLNEHRDLVINAPVGIFMSTPQGYFRSANPAMARMFGYETPEKMVESINDIAKQVYADPGKRKEYQCLLELHGQVVNYECRLLRCDGSKFWASISARAIRDKNGDISHYQGFIIDVTKHKESEEALQGQSLRLQNIIQGSNVGTWEWNVQTGEAFFDENWTQILGYSLDELSPISIKTMEKLTNPNDLSRFNKLLMRHFAGELSHFDFECRMKHKNGCWIWIHSRGRVVTRTPDGKPLMMFGTHTDITKRKQTEERLKYLSFHDQLTGVYNRAYFENEMKRLNKSREYPVTIISIDVDGLKLINDSHGHEYGDKLLIQCVVLLQEALRKSDILARYGGDEFVAFLPRTDYQTGKKIIDRIRDRIDKHNQTKQDQLPLSFSMGMAVAEDAEKDIASVFKEADDLMYLNKMKKDVTARTQIIRSLMSTMKERTFANNSHLHRLESLCRLVGKKVELSEKQLKDLALLAQVHDLGKVGIPDHILFKPSPLTEEEWKIMRKHPENGNRIARASIDLAEIADLILKHRERWDGEGYPLGLKGREIPIECRILAIIDAYDAMTNYRPYRKAMSFAEAMEELRKCAGTQFDPDLVEVFLEVVESDCLENTPAQVICP